MVTPKQYQDTTLLNPLLLLCITKLWMQPRRETCSMKERDVMKEGDDIRNPIY